MAERPTLYLLDGHALAYRHHFAMINRPLTSAKTGEIVSAVFGFSRALLDLMERERPHYLAVAFDEGLTGRDQLYPNYKGTREKMPDDLAAQMGRIQEVVRAFNIPILSLPGYEADDVMGTIAAQAEEQDIFTRIITGDRDLFQLLTSHVSVRFSSTKAGAPDEVYDPERFRAEYGFEPIHLTDYKGLVGDSSDNIPGVRGIGDKTARALLREYTDLERIYENIAQIKGALQRKLIEGRELAFLSRRLATIHRDAPIKLDLNACVAHEFERAAVEALFRELEFGSLFAPLDRLAQRASKTAAQIERAQQLYLFEMNVPVDSLPGTTTIIVDSLDKLDALAERLKTASLIAFDTETTGTSHVSAQLVGISLAADAQTGFYIPLGHRSGAQLPIETALDALRPAMTDPTIPKAAHNALFDFAVLRRFGLEVAPIACDTMVAKWLLDPNDGENVRGNLSLKRLARIELNIDMTPIERLIGAGKSQLTMDQVSIESAANYAAADALVTWQLVPKLKERLAAEPLQERDPLWGTENPPTLTDLFHSLELPLIPVLAAMELTGVLLDTDHLAALSRDLGRAIAALEREIHALAGKTFNINSPKQMNEVLFEHLKLKAEGVRKTSLGFSTAADVLDSLRGAHPVVDKILEYRELVKLKGTYVDALPALINPVSGRVHTSYNQTGTSTGRISSSDPNLQNIPIRTETGRAVRAAFIAPPGWRLLSVDYSQIELRILAHVSKEPALLKAFAEGQDIHAATAAILNNVPMEAVTKEQRIFAKRVNFGILYGMGAYRLARDSDLTLAEARKFIETYFERLPGVRRYIESAKALARSQGYLTTLFGRRRRFPGITSSRPSDVSAAEREAINMPIQGTAADIMKRAMIDLDVALRSSRLRARLLLQVHDELVLEVPEEELAETAALVVRVMENAAALDAPLKANAQAGVNWRDVAPL
jgi:DNA polymerase-1